MPNVFISYSRKDIDFVRRLAGDLEKAGYDIWWDLTDLRGGDDWVRAIPSAIEASDFFLVILTPSAAESEWVRKEYTQALSLGKKIIPIMLARTEAPFELSANNYLDWVNKPYEAALAELVALLKQDSGLQSPAQSSGARQVRKGEKTKAPTRSPRNIGGYEIRSEIGQGGLATVYRGYDSLREREVAVKILPPELIKDPQFVARLERVAIRAEQLQHAAIVPVYDAGRDDDQLFIVMRYMGGGNLRGRIRQRPLTVQAAAQILAPVASALDYAHTRGFIHRDLTPGNILFDEQNNPAIADFGLAEILGSTGPTEAAPLVGTPAYLSPEQARGRSVDRRADLYALGIILFEMLTGRPPYENETPAGVLVKHVQEPVPNILDFNPDLPQYLNAIIQKALAKSPGARFQLAADLVKALKVIPPDEGVSESAPDQAQAAADETLSQQASTPGSAEQQTAEPAELTPEQLAEREARLQAAIAANLLANNRSQPVLNDKPQGKDQLGIQGEVEALAETLLLRDVEPPVSVGVMGGWGSGKSFAMYLIHQYVQATRARSVRLGWAARAEDDVKVPAFVGHIYQINFNAWTYAKSNLWASLMDTIFSCLNRQMQYERLLAHREFAPGQEAPTPQQIKDSMLAGGEVFKKIYLDNPQFSQDKDLEQWSTNLAHWSQHLLKGTLLWNVMRGQQVETLKELKDTEEQLNQLKTRREQFEQERALDEKITPKDLVPTARQAYFQSLKSFTLAFLSEELGTAAKEKLKQQEDNP